MKPTRIQR